MPIILARVVADAIFVAVLLFGSAGTIAWWRAWVLVGVLLVVRVVSAVAAYQVNPVLIRERAGSPIHGDQPTSDKLLVIAVMASGYVMLPIIAGVDTHRWHLLAPPRLVCDAGILLFALGWILKGVVLRTNAFAAAAVRFQGEPHRLIDHGVYRVVRHPFYAGTVLITVGLGLWLESSAATAMAVVPLALVIARIIKEERFLRATLPGYEDFTRRVRFRLVPGAW